MNDPHALRSSRPSSSPGSGMRPRASSAPDIAGNAVRPLRRSEPPPRPAGERGAFLEGVVRGLTQSPKRLPSAYMFDAVGARLFACLSSSPHHPLLRREQAILHAHRSDIASEVGPGVRFVDLAVGDGLRAFQIVSALRRPAQVVLADRAPGCAIRAARILAADHRDMPTLALDETPPWTAELEAAPEGASTTLLYLGASTIGELEPREARAQLGRLAHVAGDGGRLLVSLDLRGEGAAHEAAYDDAPGVAAAFDANLLARINRELGADFDLASFKHEAVYDEARGRVELRLVSSRWQWVAVGGQWFNFAAGEPIVTLVAYKYTIEWFSAVASAAGWKTDRVFLDPERRHALVSLRRV